MIRDLCLMNVEKEQAKDKRRGWDKALLEVLVDLFVFLRIP